MEFFCVLSEKLEFVAEPWRNGVKFMDGDVDEKRNGV